jgi:uncharacterized membrane protein (UPF0182 family)
MLRPMVDIDRTARAGRWLIGALLVFLMLAALIALPRLWIEYRWFGEVGFRQVFLTTLTSQWLVQAGFGAAFLVIFLGSVLPAIRNIPPNFSALRELRAVLPVLEGIRPVLRVFAIAGGLGLAWLVAQWAGSIWLDWLRFRHAQAFGVTDPVFGRDLSFYVFTLPFLRAAGGFAAFSVASSLLAATVAYVLQGQLWARPGFLAVTAPARRHLAVLVAALLVTVAFGAWLARFGLLQSSRGFVTGAGFTDLHATLPALGIFAGVALVAALAILVESWRPGFRVSLVALAAVVACHLLLVQLWPSALQRFIVAPNEIDRERPYIAREIAATRFAYGLDDVQEGRFPAAPNLDAESIAENAATIDNIRLWEVEPLKKTNAQLQEIRTYYDFVDVDNDRYTIGGELRQVALSARELNPAALPARIWINEHLTYTHGYGACIAPVNRISPEGLPEYFVQNIPPVSSVPELAITRPEIYYGEVAAEYAFVHTKAKEFDYPSGEENVYTTYAGDGGIPVGGLFDRLLLAAHFGEPKIVLSSDIGAGSRLLIHRTVRERVSRIAPFLSWENDPYLVVRDDGTLIWMIDGYTTSGSIPYAATLGRLGNYIRNPVKATVDAYHGRVTLWNVEPDEPLARSYASMFPGVFADADSMPDDLRRHMRYPVGMFSVQARIYATYHMDDPQIFYNKEDLWRIARRQSGGDEDGTVSPYFTIMKLAGVGDREEFILMLPFTPARKENLIAWMSARCDPPNYGKLLVYQFPKQRLVYGPQQIESRINQDTEIAKELTLWNQQGSQVIRGNLLVVPVDSSVVYFQPLYIESSGQAALPELKRILVAFGDRIAMEPTMSQALARIFGRGAPADVVTASAPAAPGSARAPGGDDAAAERLRRATEIYRRAQHALRRGDLAGYAREMDTLGDLLEGAGAGP